MEPKLDADSGGEVEDQKDADKAVERGKARQKGTAAETMSGASQKKAYAKQKFEDGNISKKKGAQAADESSKLGTRSRNMNERAERRARRATRQSKREAMAKTT
jgi:hypothetical protein